jgi:hypothetical protein
MKTGLFFAHFLAAAMLQSNRSLPSLTIQDERGSLLPVSAEENAHTCVGQPVASVWLPSHWLISKTFRREAPPVRPQPKRTASQGLSLNRSQYGGCSTKYNTPAGTQVVYRRFGGEQVVFPESSQTELKPEK